MKKNIITAALMIVGLCHNVFAQKSVTIKGTVTGDLKGYNKVYFNERKKKPDSTVITNGKFQFNLPFKKTFFLYVSDEYDRNVKKGYKGIKILVDEAGTIQLNDIDISKGMSSATVSGVKSAIEYQDFNKQEHEVYAAIDDQLKAKYGYEPNDKKSYRDTAYQKESGKLYQQKIPALMMDFLRKHPDAYTSAYKLMEIGCMNFNVDELEGCYKLLSKKRQQSEEGKTVSQFISGFRRSKIGEYVKDFALTTPEGKTVNFSDFKGKYVLVDFWASWCGACIGSFPVLKDVYKKYKSDKFEVYTISIDQSKEKWLGAVKELQLPWIQAIDSKDIAYESFAVAAVPTTYLIDPTGKIIAKNLHGEALEKKLAEVTR